MNNPLVSIIIPLYNSENFIKKTIESLLNQSYKNIELIIIDDHSTDQSYQLVKTYQSNKIRLEKNIRKGACAARNYGFQLSKGDYIQYLDADDILSKNKIETQVAQLSKNDSNSIASCGWTKFSNDNLPESAKQQVINKSYEKPYLWLVDSFNGNGMGLISIWLTPRYLIEKAGNWNESLLINQDGEFFCRVLLKASNIIFCDEILAYYRMHANSITQQKRSLDKIQSQLHSYKLCEEHLINHNNDVLVKKSLGNLYLKFIYHNDRFSKKLSQQAWSYFFDLNIGKPWIVGGAKFKTIAKVIGFNNALKIIRLLN